MTRAPGAGDLAPRKTREGVYLALIDGEWTACASGGVHPNVDPAARTRVLGSVPECSREEVERAVAAAERDFDAWRLLTGDFRTKVFFRLAELLKESEEHLTRAMTREMGKTLHDSRLDWLEAVGVCEAVAPQGANLKGHTYPRLGAGIAMEGRLAPRGVAAIITPFNFPVAIPLAQIAAALVTGNTVVWKPSHLTPESSQALALIVREALEAEGKRQGIAVPPGVFHMILGDASTGDALIRSGPVRTISFTGSKQVGDKVDSIASAMGKRVMKEVSGINVFYVHRAADMERAARNFLYGKTITGGQRCSSIQEVLADGEVFDEFVRRAVELAPRVVHGPGDSDELARADRTGERFSCPPLASEEQVRRLEALVESSIAAGARVIYRAELPAGLREAGFYYPLTFLGDVRPGNPLHHEEAFGPVAVLTRVQDLSEAIRISNEKVGIVACIDSRDKSATENFIERVLRTRIDDGRHGTGCYWGTKFGGDRGAGSGNPALDEDMVLGYCIWKTIYRT
ncbi:MAG TPA: aldehyde dehydrogenase family protein, partial [Planctomycetota bacterium]|nr:aldehyde dehydrogenase family protein [Planctomycetota bacterium]